VIYSRQPVILVDARMGECAGNVDTGTLTCAAFR
jgi:hypothetical protein